MGLSIIGSGIIILITLVIVMYTIPGIMDSVISIGDVSFEVSDLENSILQTDISLDTISTSSGKRGLLFNLNNDGIEKLWDYQNFEVFVTYDADISGISTRVTEKVNFNKNDFNVQRGCAVIGFNEFNATLTAGVDYTVPTGETFVRIVNTRLTGNGPTTGDLINEPLDDFTAFVSYASDFSREINFTRIANPPFDLDDRICWELIDYQGSPTGPNAIRVLDQDFITYGSGSTIASGNVVTAADDNDVAVFITGQAGDENNNLQWNEALSTAAWNSGTSRPDFTRGTASGSEDTNDLSYAVVEFTGSNWIIQRVEHNYFGNGVESEAAPGDFNAVNSLSKAFLHTQHRSTGILYGLDESGEQAWLFSTGEIRFDLQDSASTPPHVNEYFTVAWIIENTQGPIGPQMNVQHQSGIRPIVTPLPTPEDIFSLTLANPVGLLDTTSIMGENAISTGAGTSYPRGALTFQLTADDIVTGYRADQGQAQNYRFSVVEWPSAESFWKIDNIVTDVIDPGILNEDEIAQISVGLTYPIASNGDVVVVLSTDNGVTSSNSIIAT